MSRLLNVIRRTNRFADVYKSEFRPVIVDGLQVGAMKQKVAEKFSEFPDVFVLKENEHTEVIELNPAFRNYNERTEQIDRILRLMRQLNMFESLRGWRNEFQEVRADQRALFKVERSATGLFGSRVYAACVNGYVRHPKHGLCVWLQKRSNMKELFPGTWDVMAVGAIQPEHSAKETAITEAAEEASIPIDFAKHIKSAGSVSLVYEGSEDIYPLTTFTYDLELPIGFEPYNGDGEVQKFELVPAEEYLNLVLSPEWTVCSYPTSIDFLIRHGVICPENEPNFNEIVELVHAPLQTMLYTYYTTEFAANKRNKFGENNTQT